MRHWLWFGVIGVCLSASACDSRSQKPAATTAPSPQSATAGAPTSAPTTQARSYLDIDGKSIEFPPACILLSKKHDGVWATLYSDDPPNAIDANYAGNSFYLIMPLDIDDPADIGSAHWYQASPDKKEGEANNGIFLKGLGQQLRPLEVKVTFEKDGDLIAANIEGKFERLDQHDLTAPAVAVSGRLEAKLKQP